MTDDEFDFIASAYVDGEATDEEVAMVERDPALRARVEAFRPIVESIGGPIAGPGPEVKERHLAAALTEFDALFGAPGQTDTPLRAATEATSEQPRADVIDFAKRQEESAKPSTGRTSNRRSGRVFPTWLSAAAVFLVVGGGAIFAASQLGQAGESSADEASADFAEAEEVESAEAADQADFSQADGDTSADAEATRAVEAPTADAMAEDDAMEDGGDAASDESTSSPAEGEAADDSESDEEAGEEEITEGESAESNAPPARPFDPVLQADARPTDDQLLAVELELRQDPALSNCVAEIVVPVAAEPVGFFIIDVAGEQLEVVVIAEGGVESTILVDDACSVVSP